MTPTMPCPARENGDILHRYVAGTLEPDQVDPFEIHLLECEACQRAVREGAAVSAALRVEGSTPRHRLRWMIPLAVAAAVAAVLLRPTSDPIRELGRVDRVPIFEGLPVRADPDSASALVDRGMAAYDEENYGRAAEHLSAAVALDPSPGVQFFLGIALLKTRSPEVALEALSNAIDPPDNPYASEARLYLAKAWLALGEADSALALLATVPLDAGPFHDHALALADSVRRATN